MEGDKKIEALLRNIQKLHITGEFRTRFRRNLSGYHSLESSLSTSMQIKLDYRSIERFKSELDETSKLEPLFAVKPHKLSRRSRKGFAKQLGRYKSRRLFNINFIPMPSLFTLTVIITTIFISIPQLTRKTPKPDIVTESTSDNKTTNAIKSYFERQKRARTQLISYINGTSPFIDNTIELSLYLDFITKTARQQFREIEPLDPGSPEYISKADAIGRSLELISKTEKAASADILYELLASTKGFDAKITTLLMDMDPVLITRALWEGIRNRETRDAIFNAAKSRHPGITKRICRELYANPFYKKEMARYLIELKDRDTIEEILVYADSVWQDNSDYYKSELSTAHEAIKASVGVADRRIVHLLINLIRFKSTRPYAIQAIDTIAGSTIPQEIRGSIEAIKKEKFTDYDIKNLRYFFAREDI